MQVKKVLIIGLVVLIAISGTVFASQLTNSNEKVEFNKEEWNGKSIEEKAAIKGMSVEEYKKAESEWKSKFKEDKEEITEADWIAKAKYLGITVEELKTQVEAAKKEEYEAYVAKVESYCVTVTELKAFVEESKANNYGIDEWQAKADSLDITIDELKTLIYGDKEKITKEEWEAKAKSLGMTIEELKAKMFEDKKGK